MFRPIPALAAAIVLTLLAGCSMPLQRSQPSRSSSSEAIAGPDCRAHCERSYRVCMDSAAPRRGSEDERRDRLFGPTAGCEEQMRSCFRGCAPVQ
ncbi:hypothetical protein [Azospirillum sp. TSO22-1]|uniref:hypothetical protein n=1 Tax=Azospirillum sp. TSO22-1 TaxID=716789 RepID=UPI000D60C891|nr:hypothetical protein [Azospirillum sp. TSO22-1]PWC43825.1 hypothetical protein TSO221_18910 [Azospirillum sp. TSO22-1]